ncbi:non-ribosomal peptide synthetase [Paraburkholderia flava]|uniref:non-ribosomal peptide synthetase n=1 Tax=Paraburkholderia flava TaxID=2547393 RepID=UPI0010622D5A|nr:non-ribosomal peptide synthetase [Paraburkholderia flava]
MSIARPTFLSSGATSLAARLRALAEARADASALITVDADGDTRYDYAALDRRATRLAAYFSARHATGERALLLLDSGVDYVSAFFGCLYAGVVAVPVYPPESKREQHLARLRGIAQDAGVRYVLTTADLQTRFAEQYAALAPNAEVVAVDALCAEAYAQVKTPSFTLYDAQPDDIAFLQYTSGSTGMPKGVMVSHGNLVANEIAIKSGLGVQDDDVFVSWLPLYHDMGLIGSMLQPVFSGIPLVLMSPQYFLERPLRWLQAIARHRGTISGAPDFAYRLCVERVRDDALAQLDLSSWRLAFSGSEPVRRDTLDAFVERFARAGFDAAALYPCYGLAEATLFVTGGTRGTGMVSNAFATEALAASHVAVTDTDVTSTTLVACGAPQSGHTVAIVDQVSGETLAAGRIGEIHVSGPSIAHGYWQRADASAQTFRDDGTTRWLRTGDLGFMHDGQLYIAGRCKDLIIVRGKNLYPQDVEQPVEAQCEFVRKGRVIAFAAEIDGIEGPGLALEVAPMMKKRFAPDVIVEQLSRCVFDACGEVPVVVVLLNPAALPKTSSGKLQRAATRQGWQNNTLDAYAVWQQGRFVMSTTPLASAPVAVALEGIEKELAALWSDVLGCEIVTRDAHFFLSGGSSLTAVRLAARITERWQRPFEIGEIFEAPTLEGMAHALSKALAEPQHSDGDTGAVVDRIERAGEQPPVASHAQQRQLFAWQLDPESRAYHIATGIRLRGTLDAAALRASVDALVARHPALRTRFVEMPGSAQGYVPQVQPATPLAWLNVDLLDGAHDRGTRDDRLAQLARRFADEPFDLLNGPVLRAGLVRCDADEHVLLLALHHIATDGWSMQIVIDELVAHYRALTVGSQQSAELAEPALDYTDYAAWQHRWLDSADAQRQLDYWRNELSTEAPPLALPFDHAQSVTDSSIAAARTPFVLPSALAHRVRDAASRHRTTPFVLLLAVYHAWLYRVTGQADIRTGVPVANRERRETHDIVGFFTNTIVLRSVCEPALTPSALLAALRRAALDGQQNQALPFDVLVEQLNPERNAQHGPLFETSFNYLSDEYPSLDRLPGLQASRYEIAEAHVKVPLALDLRESRDGGMRGYMTYAASRFDAASIARMVAQYVRAIETFTAALDSEAGEAEDTLATLDLLSPVERARCAAVSRGTEPAQRGEPLHLRVARHAAAQPDARAVVDGPVSISYRELDERAQRVAYWLLDRGLKAGESVAIVADRSAAFVVALLGILKAGGAYVPLDAANPSQRLEQALRGCGARFALWQHAVPALDVDGIVQTTIDDVLRDETIRTHALPTIDPRAAAYVIYTSGSSGAPKGVVIPHGALTHYVDAVLERLALPAGATFAMVSTVAADLGNTVLFGALATGGALHLIDRDTTLDADCFAQYMATHRIDVLKIVPGHLHALLQARNAADALPLHTLVVGGEATAWPLLETIRELRPTCRVMNHYGPTETTIGILMQDAAQASRDAATLPLGVPLGGACTYVLDAHMNPLGTGETGELYLGGPGVARGYLNRPGMTAERFMPDPFTPGARLYRSGDRARRLADGTIEYLGRADDQVKVRGYRVEPGEIAARLRTLDGVRDAAVIVTGAGRLAGFVAALPDCTLDTVVLKQQIAALLPDYMVPSTLRVLGALPRNRNGKLDRQALVELARVPVKAAKRVRSAPQGETETTLARIWVDVLGLAAQVGETSIARDDNFFALGGHSLAAMRMLSRVRAAWPVDIPLRAVFVAPTLQALAARIEQLNDATSGIDHAPLRAVPRQLGMSLPLSLTQQRIWVVDQLAGGALASYNMAAGLDLRGPLDTALLHASLAALVERHEVLRSSFGEHDGDPVLAIAATLDVPMPLVDCSTLDASQREATVARMLDDASQTPFDLAVAPLLRASLVRFDAQHHVLVLALHHIVADGASVHVLIDELCAVYAARRAGSEPALRALPVQYADYAVWQREQLKPPKLRDEQTFWRTYLADAPHRLALPTDRPRPAIASHAGSAVQLVLPGTTGERVRALAAARGMTPFAVLLASFQLFLHRVTGQTDLLVGTDVAGRDRTELEALIGFFVNVLPVRSRIADDRANVASFNAWLDAAKQSTWDALEHRALPFDRIVDALAVARRRDANPLLQLLFVLRDLPHTNTTVPDLSIELLRSPTTQSKFDMALFVEPVDGGYEVEWVYASALFERATVEQWFAQWRELLDRVSAAPDVALDVLPAALIDKLPVSTTEPRLPVQTSDALHAAIPQ